MADSLTIDDLISKTFIKTIRDSLSIDDSISITVTYRIADTVLTSDTILRKIATSRIRDSTSIDDKISLSIGKTMKDSVFIDDTLTKSTSLRLLDEIIVSESGFKIVIPVKRDDVIISDVLRATTVKPVNPDSATFSDSISKRVTYGLLDEIMVSESGFKIVIPIQTDQVIISDVLRATTIKPVNPDSATISDSISRRITIGLSEGILLQEDITILTIKFRTEMISVSDTLRATPIKPIKETATIGDSISKRVTYGLSDSVIVSESGFKIVIKVGLEEIFIDDTIRPILIRVIDPDTAYRGSHYFKTSLFL